MKKTKLVKIGFIPLVDAAALIVAADMGFAAQEGLKIELVREVSWSNVRDRLALGHFDAAHLLTPMAVASKLGLNQVRVPLAAPVNLALNGDAITVSPALFQDLQRAAQDGLANPLASARALREIAQKREASGLEPLTFGMTFPFSMHNYQLRYWMAEGGIDPDKDLRLVVLPPPFMVESLAKGHVDGFCVGAPWNSVAVEAGVGVVLHLGCEIFARAPEKVLAMRESALAGDPELAAALTRAIAAAAVFVDAEENRAAVGALLARPDRVDVDEDLIVRTLEGRLRLNAEGEMRSLPNYLVIGARGGCRPDSRLAAWIYAQMLRWRQAPFSAEALADAKSVLRADLFDAATAPVQSETTDAADAIGAFSGPSFDEHMIEAYVNAFEIGAKI